MSSPEVLITSRWVGAFNAASGFSNSGMMLLDANMVAFQTSRYMLLTVALLVLAGNTWSVTTPNALKPTR